MMWIQSTVCLIFLIATPWTAQATVDDFLGGMSTPDLKSLLKDLDYDQYNNALNALEYGEAPEYISPPESGQKIGERAESVFRPVVGKPLFSRPKGMKGKDKEGKEKAAVISHQATTSAAEANAAAAAMLPAYCDPPNPCPLGYTEADGCIEEFENSSDFSRIYQSRQKCICDTEHMFNCPDSSNNSNSEDDEEDNEIGNDQSFMSGVPSLGFGNPYLAGQKLPIAAKKGMGF